METPLSHGGEDKGSWLSSNRRETKRQSNTWRHSGYIPTSSFPIRRVSPWNRSCAARFLRALRPAPLRSQQEPRVCTGGPGRMGRVGLLLWGRQTGRCCPCVGARDGVVGMVGEGVADLEQWAPEEVALLGAVLCDFDLPSSTSWWAVVILEENKNRRDSEPARQWGCRGTTLQQPIRHKYRLRGLWGFFPGLSGMLSMKNIQRLP